MAMPMPRAVRPDPEAEAIEIDWRDGRTIRIPYRVLREHCPCARCKDTRDKGGAPLIFALSTRMTSWRRVGNYALHFQWADSHQDGIFAYDLLDELARDVADGSDETA